MRENNILLDALLELATELSKHNVQLIIGGGLSLYIRTTFLSKERSARYTSQIFQRSTKDIDIFLSCEMILDYEKL